MLSKEGLEEVTKDVHTEVKINNYLKDIPYMKVSTILNETIGVGHKEHKPNQNN